MNAIKPLLLLTLPFLLLSAKCKEAKTENFVDKAEVHTVNGGVYGSGYSIHYEITFSPELTEELTFDSMILKADNESVYKRIARENAWGLKKLKDGKYYLDAYFQGGERMQASGEINEVIIPTYPMPKAMENKEGIVYGKYGKKNAVVLISKFTVKESVNLP